MGRPPKNSDTPEARSRLIDAFWTLLAHNRLSEITIGMIVAEAGCNRNTFYYHFENKDALIASIIQNEMNDTAIRIFNTVAGFDDGIVQLAADNEYVGKIALFIEQGGMDIIQREVKQYILGVWQAVLRPHGEPLSDGARSIIEGVSGFTLSLVTYLGSENLAGRPTEPPLDYLHEQSNLAISYICRYEGLGKDEVLERLRMLERYSNMP